MKRTLRTIATILIIATVITPVTGFAQLFHTEDFTTTDNLDAVNTTADWNTAEGVLRLQPFAPSLVGSYATPSECGGVVIEGNYAFVADFQTGLWVFDISDPATPSVVDTYSTTGHPRAVAVAGDHAYVADSDGGIQVLDISNPASLTLVGSYAAWNAYGVTVAGDYAYVADWTHGLIVLDISDPTSPTLAGSYDTLGLARSVTVAGDHAFVADSGVGLLVIDIGDPTNPTLAGSYTGHSNARGVVVAGDHAFVADRGAGLLVIDISDPTNPTLTGSFDPPGYPERVTVAGDRAFLGSETTGLQVIDISDPANPTLAFSHSTPDAYEVAVAGDHAYIADAVSGLLVVRITQPVAPTLAGSYTTPSWARRVAVSGDHAVAVHGTSGMSVIDISDPGNPVSLGSYNTPDYARGIDISGDLALVADDDSGLLVIDVSDPASPTEIGSYDTPGEAYGVAMAGDLAFVTDNDNGLIVLDISDPTTPSLVGTYATGSAWNVTVSGDYAYVVGGPNDFQILDITNPATPSLVGSYNTPSATNDVVVSGDYAFLACQIGDLVVLDISDPTNPTEVGDYETPGEACGVALSGDLLCVADKLGGLQVFDISDPAIPTLASNYPTPEAANGVALSGELAFVAGNMGLQLIAVFQSEVNDPTDNVGQSLPLGDASDSILRLRLTSTETPGVAWEISDDSGANFQTITPNGAWVEFETTGDEFLWRSTHTWSPGLNPTVSSFTLEWLEESAPIMSITDVPDDQGGRIDLEFARSAFDFPDPLGSPIVGYAIYRRVDDSWLLKAIAEAGTAAGSEHLADSHLASYGAEQVRVLGDRTFVLGGNKTLPNTFPPGAWEDVGWLPRFYQETYTDRVHTAADSTTGGMTWSVYVTATVTTTPDSYYVSQPDSGYSVDNIPPSVPVSLAASYDASGVALDWDNALEADFQYHRVYRGTDPGFIPAPGNLVQETVSSIWTDPTSNPWGYYYKVTTLDDAGNESEAAEMQSVSAVGDNVVPTRTALLAAYPNPFNPSTKLSFELAAPARVRLNIFDAAGRLVNTLVDEQRGVGRHEFVWNGQNTAGQSVASGVYLYRFEAGDVVQTKRMMLVK